jgi:hypothetical protein
MEKEFLEWIRQANGLLLEAYRRQAQECRLCWVAGELRFQALIASTWAVIKAVPLESAQYLRLFHLATQMIDDGGYFQIRLPEASAEPTIAYRINFQIGADAADCAVRLLLERQPGNAAAAEEPTIELAEDTTAAPDELLDSEYIN